MKTVVYFVTCTILSLLSASAADIDAQLLRFAGKLPATADLIRLVNSDSMPALRSFSAACDADGDFGYRALTPVAYPTKYDSTGKWITTEDRDTGILFSGKTKVSDGSYLLDFQFRFVEFTSAGVYRTDSGAAVAQPVFQHHDLNKKVTVHPGEWTLVPLPDNRESHLALLVRIRN